MAKSKSRAQKNNAAKKKRAAHRPQHAKQSAVDAKGLFDKSAETQFRITQITSEVVEHIRAIGMSKEEFEIRLKILFTFPPRRETEAEEILAIEEAIECFKKPECISEFHELYKNSIFYNKDASAYTNQVDAEFKCSSTAIELVAALIDNLSQNDAVCRTIGCHHHLTLFALLEYAVKHTMEYGVTKTPSGTPSYVIPFIEASVAATVILSLGACFDMAQTSLDFKTISLILDTVGITPSAFNDLPRKCKVLLRLNELEYSETESFEQLAKIIKLDEMHTWLLDGVFGSMQEYEIARDKVVESWKKTRF